MVRSVYASEHEYCGFVAYYLLNHRFNPRTPARMLQCLQEGIRPGVVKDVRQLTRAVEDWEAKIHKLRNEFGEELSENIKSAIFVSMLPNEFKDIVYQMGSIGKDMKYLEIRDKVVSIAGMRAQKQHPSPMDIGAMERAAAEMRQWGVYEEEEWGGGEFDEGIGVGDLGVEAVGKGGCHKCGEMDHWARECPHPWKGGYGKGKGKGGKGGKGPFPYGKGFQKGYGKNFGGGKLFGKGGGKDGKGKGKGYQGTCYACGEVGHKAHECRFKKSQPK